MITGERKTGSGLFESFTGQVGGLVSSHPGKVIIAFLLVTFLMVIPLINIDTSTRMSDFFPESRFLDADGTLRTEFNTTRRVVGVLEAGSGSILGRDGLLALEKIESSIVEDDRIGPYLVDCGPPVITIAGAVEKALSMISNGSMDIENTPEPVLEQVVELVMRNGNASMLVSDDDAGKYGIVIIELNYNMIPPDDEKVEILLNDIIDGLDLGGYTYSSFAALNFNMQKDAQDTLMVILPISLVLVIAVLFFSLRSAAKVLVSLAGLLSSLIISFGTFSLLDLQFSQMMFFAPIVIIVLSIDYTIHLLHRFGEFREEGLGPRDAMASGIRFMGVSILLSTLTTALAFGSNSVSNIPAVSSFGIFLAIGISISFLVMVLFVPSLFIKYREITGKHEGKSGKDQDRGRLSKRGVSGRYPASRVHFTIRYPVLVVAVAFLLMGGGLFLGTMVEKDMKPGDTISGNSPVIRTLNVLRENFPRMGMESPYVLIGGDVCDPVFMTTLNECISGMADDEHVVRSENGPEVFSIMPYVRALTGTMGLSDENLDGIPDTREDLTLVLNELYDNGIEGVVSAGRIRNFLSRGAGSIPFDMTLIMVEARNVEGPRGGLLLQELETDLEPIGALDGVKISYTGFTFERFEMMTEMTDGMIRSTFITSVLCALVVILLMRSVKYGMITSLPIIFVIGWILGSMYLLGYTLNMVTATITSMTVGVGVDYSIHMTERYRQEKRQNGQSHETILKAISTTGSSLIAAALTTLAGFVVMAFSSIGMYRSFGVLASLMVLFSLLSALIVLPAMMVLSERFSKYLLERFPGMPGTLRGIVEG